MLRIDDFPQGTPDDRLPLSQIEKLLTPFEKLQVEYYLCVVPFLCRNEELNFLRGLEYCRIALHGFTHGVERWRPSDMLGGEFYNLSSVVLWALLQRSLDVITKTKKVVKVFVPPFNVFTQDLINILNTFKFEIIWGGPETVMHNLDKLNFGKLQLLITDKRFYTSASDLAQKLQHGDQRHPLTIHLPNENIKSMRDLASCLKDINR